MTLRNHLHSLAACTLVSGSLFLSPWALAHETWLLPETFQPAADEPTTILMTSGMAFPALGSGISSVRIKEAVLSQSGERSAMVPVGSSIGALQLSAVPGTGTGTACAWVALDPRILNIKEDAVAHYLEEVGADDTVWAAWEAQAEPRQWQESYTKLARTYLRAGGVNYGNNDGDNQGEDCWTDQSDTRFDILPTQDPGTLSAGDRLSLQLLFDGEPLANQAVGLIRAGDDPGELVRSNTDGTLTLEFAEGGNYMVFATKLWPGKGEGFNWESNFVTLTFMVKDKQ